MIVALVKQKPVFQRNFKYKFPEFFQTFSGLFPDFTFPNDIPSSNTGTNTVANHTMKIKLSIL